jgi:hypothetical protein
MPRLGSYSRSLLGVGLNTIQYAGNPTYWTPTENTALIVDATRKAITHTNNTTISKLGVTTIKDELFGEAAINVSSGAVQFTGGDIINFSNWPMLYTNNEWTIEFWFKYTGTISDFYQVLFYAADASNGRIVGLFFDTTGKIRLIDPNTSSTTALEYDDGVAHHIVVQKNGTTLNCWIDGTDKISRDVSGYGSNSATVANSIRFGNYITPTSNAHYIDAIRISNVAIYPNTTTITVPTGPIQRYSHGVFYEYQGGYYAGAIYYGAGGPVYDLFIAPKANWVSGAYDSEYNQPLSGAQSSYDGATNTAELLASGRSPLANNISALNINGFNDWYIPAIWELAEVYWNLKPTNIDNYTLAKPTTYAYTSIGMNANGDNLLRYPIGTVATATNPSMTSVAEFANGGSQKINLAWVHSSTNVYNTVDSPSLTNNFAIAFDWQAGGAGGSFTGFYQLASKTNAYYTLPMRKVLRQTLN